RRRGSLHKVDLLLAFLDGLGVPSSSQDLKVVLTPAEHERAESRWRELGLPPSAPAAGVIVGGRGDKRSPARRLQRLLEQRHDGLQLAVVLFAGPEDGAQLHRLSRDLQRPVVIAPRLSVRDFAALLRRCAVVVTTDTGPMHLAAATGVPTVSVFDRTAAGPYAPRGTWHRAVTVEGDGVDAAVAAVADVLSRMARQHAVPPSPA